MPSYFRIEMQDQLYTTSDFLGFIETYSGQAQNYLKF